MSGGCSVQNLEAVRNTFHFSMDQPNIFRSYKALNVPRYGHSSIAIGSNLFVLGGFDHKDDEMNNPNTLKSCECILYSQHNLANEEPQWSQVAPMITERAYFSICQFHDAFIYAFGGLQNYDTIDTIEQYELQNNSWNQISIKMPLRIAKFALSMIDEENVIIVGGLLMETVE